MHLFRAKNRRWLAWALTLALVIMAVPSGAIWRCTDGTPCPAGCPMLRAAHRPESASAPRPACSHCPSTVITSAKGCQGGSGLRPMSGCVMSRGRSAAAALLPESSWQPLAVALVPRVFYRIDPVVSTASGVAPPVAVYAQNFPRGHSGRAPPHA